MKTKTYYLYISGVLIFETLSRKCAIDTFNFLLLHINQSSNMVVMDDCFNIVCSSFLNSK